MFAKLVAISNLILITVIPPSLFGQNIQLGDLDGDGVATVRDVAKLQGLVNGTLMLSQEQKALADLDGNGAVNAADAELLVQEILETRTPEELSKSTVRFTSPANGESGVAVTRETVVHFTIPLALDTTIDTTQFFAEFGGEKVLSRVEVAGDRMKATLFYLEPLPSNARVQVTFDGTGISDLVGRGIDADEDGEAGGIFKSSFTTSSTMKLEGTAVIGRVFASVPGVGGNGNPVDVPLAGVTITVDGEEEELRAVTDAQGNFVLDPSPAGSFFVHIDGRTSPLSDFPGGAYYPFVGKEWTAIAGRKDNLAGGSGTIYLPFIPQDSLKAVSPVEETVVSFPAGVIDDNPALAGTEIMIPPNSLFANDGTRGGMVGIAPVAPERLPEPLPPGLEFPLVITIQTDGATNFDQPVPVRFPNLPDPRTGETLGPGEKSAYWSFNHDLGRWKIVGPMTVSADGRFVVTDPGVGVRQPGWGAPLPGCSFDGGPPIFPPCSEFGECQEVKNRANERCIRNVILSLVGLNPFSGCAVSIVTSAADALEDAQRSGQVDYGGATRNALIGCIPGAGTSRAILGCVVGIADASTDLSCVSCPENGGGGLGGRQKNHRNSNGGVPVRESPIKKFNERMAALDARTKARLTLQVEILSALDEIVEVMYPHSIWTERENLDRANQLFGDTQKLTSSSGGIIDSSEIENLKIKLGPMGISDSTIDFTVNFNNRTTESYNAGIFDHSDSASDVNDFIDRSDFQVKLKRFSDSLKLAENQGWSSPMEGLHYVLGGNYNRAVNGIAKVVSGPIQQSYYYLVEDFSTGEIRRGKSDGTGTITDLTLRPNTYYRIVFLGRLQFKSSAIFFSGPSGSQIEGGLSVLSESPFPDADGDGLRDFGEEVLGTDPMNPDSDEDGILDGAELEQGTNPLSGVHVGEGIIAVAPSSSRIVDLCAVNDMTVTANGNDGVTIYNVFSGLNPTRIIELNTPGNALSVACFGNLIGVADFTAGLTIVDISDPSNVEIRGSIDLGSPARSVVADGPIAYVATIDGFVHMVDMQTGVRIREINPQVPGGIQDLGITNGNLYLLGMGELACVPLDAIPLAVNSRESWSPGPGSQGGSLSMGDDYCFATGREGYLVFDFDQATSAPSLVATQDSLGSNWREVVPDGSGAAIATSGSGIDLIDIGNDHLGEVLLTTYQSAGLVEQVSLYNGLAYISDRGRGLLVVNYQAYDDRGSAPTIDLRSNFDLAAGSIESGKLMRLRASVTDDVQVRQVEFLVDDEVVLIDGNFPYEFTFVIPAKAGLQVQARAIDTGGNSTLSTLFDLSISPDVSPPKIAEIVPEDGSVFSQSFNLSVRFDDPIDPDSLGDGLTLTGAGPDGVLGTGDDEMIENGVVSFRPEIRTAFISFSEFLEGGMYRLSINQNLKDLAGNSLKKSVSSTFTIASDLDSDGDGLANDWELLAMTDPGVADTDGDGIPDGEEDFDNDGLSNRGEVLLGRGINEPDSDDDGILDGDEDIDSDGLRDGLEVFHGTDPNNPDSDGDGDDDATEVFWETSPILSTSFSPPRVVTSPFTFLNAIPLPEPENPAVTSGVITFENQ